MDCTSVVATKTQQHPFDDIDSIQNNVVRIAFYLQYKVRSLLQWQLRTQSSQAKHRLPEETWFRKPFRAHVQLRVSAPGMILPRVNNCIYRVRKAALLELPGNAVQFRPYGLAARERGPTQLQLRNRGQGRRIHQGLHALHKSRS